MKLAAAILFATVILLTTSAFAQTCNVNGPIDVKACYGATGTGMTYDTVALQNAFNASASTGKPIYFPPGIYLIKSPLTVGGTYHVSGSRGASTIIAGPAFDGSSCGGCMIDIGTPQPQTVPLDYMGGHHLESIEITGGMDDLIVNCNNIANYGIVFGGWQSNSTSGLAGYGSTGLQVAGCKTAGAAVAYNSWQLSFYNSSFFANQGDGFQVLSTTGSGENVSFFGTSFLNNGRNGLTIQNIGSDGSSHTVFCFGCSFDYNNTNKDSDENGGGWGVQVGTSKNAGDVIFSAQGCHFESPTKWMQNYAYTTLSGTVLTNGSKSKGLGYLIDNEGVLNWIGGRAGQSGTGTVLKAAETGVTNIYGAMVTSPAHVTTFPAGTVNAIIDPYGTSGFNGTKRVGKCVLTIKSGIIANVTDCE